MPDVITEFCNLNGCTLSQLQAGVTLFKTGPKETAVIRDALIQCSIEAPLSLRINGTEVASFRGTSQLTGLELVGASSLVTLHMPEQPVFNGIYGASTSQLNTNSFATRFSWDMALQPASAGTNVPIAITSPLVTTPQLFCFDAAGNFFYASATGQTLYRRAGGVNGAQTAFVFGNCPVYDGSRYLYAINSNNQIVRFDTQANALLPPLMPNPAIGFNGSYGQIAWIDGALIVRPTYSNAVLMAIDLTTGAVTNIGTWNSWSGQRFCLSAAKKRNGDIIVVQPDYANPGITWWNLGPNALAPVVKESGTIPTTLSSYAGEQNFLFRLGQSFVKMLSGGTIQVFDVESLKLSNAYSIPGISMSGQAIPFLNTNQAAADFGTLTVRLTGIKTI
jgi:hypothetical protein